MKKIGVIALALVTSVVLSGCGDKKIEPNNYYCTKSIDGGDYSSYELGKLAEQGRIESVKEFYKQCRIKKLGSNNEEFIKAKKESLGCMYSSDMSAEDKKKCQSAPQDMIKKWKKEANVE